MGLRDIFITAFLFVAGSLSQVSAQTITAGLFREKLAFENGILIDVRTPKEFAAEHIRSAVNIDVLQADFRSRVKAFDRAGTYFIYCGVGKRSATAFHIMIEEGFIEVYELENGLQSWKAMGYETESSAPSGYNGN